MSRPILRLLPAVLIALALSLPSPVHAKGSAPVDLRTLEIDSTHPGTRISVPRTQAFSGSHRMVFRFLGSPKFFVGVIVKSYDAKGHLLHHGLFDQGPIDEVLSRALFHKEERIQILGIFKNPSSSHSMVLRIRRFSTNQTRDIPLPRALSLLVSRIGSQPDLVWAAR